MARCPNSVPKCSIVFPRMLRVQHTHIKRKVEKNVPHKFGMSTIHTNNSLYISFLWNRKETRKEKREFMRLDFNDKYLFPINLSNWVQNSFLPTNSLNEISTHSLLHNRCMCVWCVVVTRREGGDQTEFGTKASFQVSLCHLAAHKLIMFPQHDTEKVELWN